MDDRDVNKSLGVAGLDLGVALARKAGLLQEYRIQVQVFCVGSHRCHPGSEAYQEVQPFPINNPLPSTADPPHPPPHTHT